MRRESPAFENRNAQTGAVNQSVSQRDQNAMATGSTDPNDLHPEQDQAHVRGTYGALYGELADYADLEALLSALRNFVSYL